MFFKTTREEFIYALAHPYQWLLLGWYDIKQRYRRSILGPFWITISTAILVGTLGLLWSTLFQADTGNFLPYFAIGYIIWQLISQQLNDATTGFVQFENIIKQTRLPYPSYILRLLSRNTIIFLHNFIIIIIAVSFSTNGWTGNAILAIPGFIILAITTFFVSFIVAIFCVRYRDLSQIFQNIVTVAYFLTPIMWQAETLSDKHAWVYQYNPLHYFLEIVRKPLLGGTPLILDWVVSILVMLIFGALSMLILKRARSRISYWL